MVKIRLVPSLSAEASKAGIRGFSSLVDWSLMSSGRGFGAATETEYMKTRKLFIVRRWEIIMKKWNSWQTREPAGRSFRPKSGEDYTWEWVCSSYKSAVATQWAEFCTSKTVRGLILWLGSSASEKNPNPLSTGVYWLVDRISYLIHVR